jgi:hypothetical protein
MDWEYKEMQGVHSVTAFTFLNEIREHAIQHAAKIHAEAALAGIFMIYFTSFKSIFFLFFSFLFFKIFE